MTVANVANTGLACVSVRAVAKKTLGDFLGGVYSASGCGDAVDVLRDSSDGLNCFCWARWEQCTEDRGFWAERDQKMLACLEPIPTLEIASAGTCQEGYTALTDAAGVKLCRSKCPRGCGLISAADGSERCTAENAPADDHEAEWIACTVLDGFIGGQGTHWDIASCVCLEYDNGLPGARMSFSPDDVASIDISNSLVIPPMTSGSGGEDTTTTPDREPDTDGSGTRSDQNGGSDDRSDANDGSDSRSTTNQESDDRSTTNSGSGNRNDNGGNQNRDGGGNNNGGYQNRDGGGSDDGGQTRVPTCEDGQVLNADGSACVDPDPEPKACPSNQVRSSTTGNCAWRADGYEPNADQTQCVKKAVVTPTCSASQIVTEVGYSVCADGCEPNAAKTECVKKTVVAPVCTGHQVLNSAGTQCVDPPALICLRGKEYVASTHSRECPANRPIWNEEYNVCQSLSGICYNQHLDCWRATTSIR